MAHIDSGTVFKVGWSNKNSCEAPETFALKLKCLDSKAEAYEVTFMLVMGENNKYEIKSVEEGS